jgi:hypothetical protein
MDKQNLLKILHLTLKKAPFDVMVTGEKQVEFREKSKWILLRLFNPDGSKRHYDAVKFTNGYGKKRPYFIAKYLGFETIFGADVVYSNGFRLEIHGESWMISLGEIIEIGNLREVA